MRFSQCTCYETIQIWKQLLSNWWHRLSSARWIHPNLLERSLYCFFLKSEETIESLYINWWSMNSSKPNLLERHFEIVKLLLFWFELFAVKKIEDIFVSLHCMLFFCSYCGCLKAAWDYRKILQFRTKPMIVKLFASSGWSRNIREGGLCIGDIKKERCPMW